MARSSWKGVFFEASLSRRKFYKNLFKEVPVKIWCRRSAISSYFLDYKVQLYNGRKFYNLRLKPEITGMKWGSLTSTRCGGGMGRLGIVKIQARKKSLKKIRSKKKK